MDYHVHDVYADELKRCLSNLVEWSSMLTDQQLMGQIMLHEGDWELAQYVVRNASDVRLVRAALNTGVDPNIGVPAFYTVRSDDAAALLAPYTTMLDVHELLMRLYVAGETWQIPGDLIYSDLTAQDDASDIYNILNICGNSLAVHQIFNCTPALLNTKDLLLRVCANSVDHARGLIECGADLFATDEGNTALHNVGHPAVVEYLLSLGLDPNAKNMNGSTPLHLVDDIACVQALIVGGADVNAKGSGGQTPLHGASNVPCAKALLDAGAEIDAPSDNGSTALHIPNSPEVTQYLLSLGADPNVRDNFGRTPLFDLLFHSGHSIEALYLVRAFLASGADVNAIDHAGAGVLTYAHAREETMHALLDAGYNPLDKSLGSSGQTLLHCVASEHHVSCNLVHRIIDLGVDVNAQDSRGFTALHYIAHCNATKRLNWFLQRKADPTIEDHRGYRASHYAVKPRCVELLIEHEDRWIQRPIKRQLRLLNKATGISKEDRTVAKRKM
ncbi:ankyrin repeat domain-containing protein [Stenotrophomonas maltophilia]|uniref:ankyrin repeat domain-containing protein n=1 Tax=Stenotrophomonas maltophilia TaxID=40324 RepID=UPI0009B28522|nr:ankyrin repeat domain-containing protein [Stenotrophomonas maltophilia]